MARRYLVDPLPPPGRAPLPAEVAHHLHRVLRAPAGTEVVLFDGRGRVCTARLGGETADIGPHRSCGPEPGPAIHLGVALPKAARAELLFEQCTALGVHAIQPLITARAEARRDRRDRWRRIAAAAAGQCGRDFLPAIHAGRELGEWLDDPELPAERYVAEPGAPLLGPARSGAAVLLVGPEGGLADAERAAAAARGFESRSLGSLILRVETAALAGLVLLRAGHGTGWNSSSAKL